jgi:hypothetical protein
MVRILSPEWETSDIVEEEDIGTPVSIMEPLVSGLTERVLIQKYDILQVRMPFMYEVQIYNIKHCLPRVSPTIELIPGYLVEVVQDVDLVNPEFIPPHEPMNSKKTPTSKGQWNNLRHIRVRSTPRSLYPFQPLLFNPFYLAWADGVSEENRRSCFRVRNLSRELFNNPEEE